MLHPFKKLSWAINVPKNYRPVSDFSFISKLIEKIMAKQLNDFIIQDGIPKVHQSTYRSLHSLKTALLKIQNDIFTSVDLEKAVTITLLELHSF